MAIVFALIQIWGWGILYCVCVFFFFSSRRRHTRLQGDWSSDVCSSDLIEDRWGALAAAQEAVERFPENPDAWLLLGAAYQMVFRQQEALVAYEQALALEERPDAALAAGDLYRRAGRYADAAARFARAHAAGGGAEALWLNAQALFQAGDVRAAEEALHLWATQVPGGQERLSEARAELFVEKPGS